MTVEKATYTITEVAKILGVSRNNAYEAVKTGKLRAIHIGRRVLVPRAAIEALLGKTAGAAIGTVVETVGYWRDRAQRADAELARLRKLIKALGEDDPAPLASSSPDR